MSLNRIAPTGNGFFSDFKLNGARWTGYLSLEFAAYLYLNTKSGEALLKNLSARYIPYPRPVLLVASALSLLTFETTVLRAAIFLAEQRVRASAHPPEEKPKPKPVVRNVPQNDHFANATEALVDIYRAILGNSPDEKATDEELVQAICNGITTHREQLVKIFIAVNQEGGGVLPKTEYIIIGKHILAAIEMLKNKPFVGGKEEI